MIIFVSVFMTLTCFESQSDGRKESSGSVETEFLQDTNVAVFQYWFWSVQIIIIIWLLVFLEHTFSGYDYTAVCTLQMGWGGGGGVGMRDLYTILTHKYGYVYVKQ